MKQEDIDFSVLPSKKVCGECEIKKDIKCFYIRKFTSIVTGKISFYAGSNCKDCHNKVVTKKRESWTPEEVISYRLYQKNYYLKSKNMKKLMVLFIVLSTFCKAQDTLKLSNHWRISNTYTMTTSIYGRQVFRGDTLIKCDKIYVSNYSQNISAWISCDSIVGSKGDDKKIIRMLLEELTKSFDREQKLHEELDTFIKVSVDFSNHVPDSFRTKKGNCKWPAYLSLLNKYGWVQGKTKKPHVCSNK